ncbi:DUF397 domain-containing protein [Streptomyces sp. SPB162]|uniref:DUF397 domain-containing protein n=1 Tax=Streptomyces sp. SPB162 TaxID=2940560 RepID=UPI0024056246|nr:DUF397 domain-containing protein [Streptomyces sp. SPB162]MDF9814614.1 hypothetical protein [Streptomyces sp. SPB162]
MSHLEWQKSTFSTGEQGECIEVANGSERLVHLRESDDPHTVVTTTPRALRALLRAAKAGALDHLS